jgi:hypothetical protein
MAKQNPRISRSGVTTTGRFPLYSNSPEVTDMDPALVYLRRGNSLSNLYLTGEDFVEDDIGDDFGGEIGDDSDEDPKKPGDRKGIPSRSDISIVSQTITTDLLGQPTVTVIFKIKNSSGETLKGMNARIEVV